MVLNRQRAVRVSIRELKGFLARAQRKLGIPSGALTICLVTNSQMARWNRDFRGKNGTTDVLSFRADASHQKRTRRLNQKPNRTRKILSAASVTSAAPYWGDIAIAPAIARENALRFGRTVDDELRILVLHGILHLMGYDHQTDTGQMERRERGLRRALGLS
jgi:probable rRNA maturation factor